MRTHILAAALSTAAIVSAQSPLATPFTGNTSLAAGGTVYFDVVLNLPLQISQIDVNSTAAAGTVGSIDVYWVAGTYVGNDTNAAAWTLGASAPVTAAGGGVPTVGLLTSPLVLPAGNYGIAITHNGIAPLYTGGNGTAVPGSGTNQTYSTAEMTLLAGASAGGAPGTAICCQPRVINCNIDYIAAGSGTLATNTVEGVGCGGNPIGDGTAYELFDAVTPFDLSSTGHTYLWTGNGYVLIDGAGPILPPVGTATPFTDDNTQAVALPFAFPCVQGDINDVYVCSNGFLSFEQTVNADFSESVAELLSQTSRLAFLWDDMNPALGGTIHLEAVGVDQFHITFTDVPEFGAAANINTCQVVLFDSGIIEVRYGVVSSVDALVGLSSANGATDPGATDYSNLQALGGVTFTTGFGPFFSALSMSALTRPVLGTSWDLQVDALPASTVLGLNWFGVSNPNIADLTFLGLPGCGLYAALDVVVGPWVPTGATYGYSIALPATPPALIGQELFTQSAIATLPAPNAFGFETTNAIKGTLGDL
tara:strand:+ start:3777 stop:5384 length:1608 start_codon:yes stop_codon:yes gene_type:complete